MKDDKQLLNNILEWANNDRTKAQSVNDLAHYLFKIVEAKQAKEAQKDILTEWDKWKKEKIDIIIEGIN